MDIPGYQNIEPFRKDEEGENYLATQQSTGRQVIVKFLSKNILPDSGSRGSYIEEGQTASAISHPNIARVHEVGDSGDNVYLVREYVPGVSLDVKYPGMGLLDKIYVVKQIAKTLDFLHSKGCGHFNLKLSNIIICEHDSRIILVGFELPSKEGQKSTVKKLSATSAIFLSPEQIKGNSPDIRSDMYSLGVIFYNLLTGTEPYRADSPAETASKHLNSDIPRLNNAMSIFQPIVDTAMAKLPENRFQSGSEMILMFDMLDDEDIIKAELQSKHIKRNSSDGPCPSGDDKKDNVVILPTQLSMQAVQSEQLSVEQRKKKNTGSQNTDVITEDSLEKLNQSIQENKTSSDKQHQESGKKSLDHKETTKPVAKQQKPEKEVLPKTVQKPNNKNQVTSNELSEQQRLRIKQLREQSAHPKDLSKEPANLPGKKKLPWRRIFLLVLILLAAVLYLGQSKVLDIPLIKPLASQAVSAWEKLSELSTATYQRLNARRAESTGTSQNQKITQPNKTGELPIKSALQTDHLQLIVADFELSTNTVDQLQSPPSQADIDWLLRQAAIKLSAGNLLQPADDNAVIFYRQALLLDGDNLVAANGLSVARARVFEQIATYIDNGQILSADALLTRMNIFFKPDATYKKLRERLDRLQVEKTTAQ